ncbi:MAG: DNA polymerase III subunit delta [Cyanobacteria bacterium P01_H01_bin.121]
MPVYLFWGDDDFALNQAIAALREQTVDPAWASFNDERIPTDQPDGAMQGLNQAMTAPFGMGKRFVWLEDPSFLQTASEPVAEELARTLPQVPETSVLVISSRGKPNGRLKAVKLLQKSATVQEFNALPPWQTEQIEDRVRQVAKAKGVRLKRASGEYLAAAVGNNTRQLHQELEKLSLYAATSQEPLGLQVVIELVTTTTQSSLQLASAVRIADVPKALELVAELLRRNEPPLAIANTLTTTFRTWLWVKLMQANGERDGRAISAAAEVRNPKRIYFLQQDVQKLTLQQLFSCLPVLLQLDTELKSSSTQEHLAILQTRVIELCTICQH